MASTRAGRIRGARVSVPVPVPVTVTVTGSVTVTVNVTAFSNPRTIILFDEMFEIT